MVIKYESEKNMLFSKFLVAIIYTLVIGGSIIIIFHFSLLILILVFLFFLFLPYYGKKIYTIIYDTDNKIIDITYFYLPCYKKHKKLDTTKIKFHYEKLPVFYLGKHFLSFFDLKNNVIINISDFDMGNGKDNKKGKKILDDFVFKLRENGVQERIVTKGKNEK
jgi:hypothetical protein